jgi:hypothetical protein
VHVCVHACMVRMGNESLYLGIACYFHCNQLKITKMLRKILQSNKINLNCFLSVLSI